MTRTAPERDFCAGAVRARNGSEPSKSRSQSRARTSFAAATPRALTAASLDSRRDIVEFYTARPQLVRAHDSGVWEEELLDVHARVLVGAPDFPRTEIGAPRRKAPRFQARTTRPTELGQYVTPLSRPQEPHPTKKSTGEAKRTKRDRGRLERRAAGTKVTDTIARSDKKQTFSLTLAPPP
jgi:hypothetical protein